MIYNDRKKILYGTNWFDLQFQNVLEQKPNFLSVKKIIISDCDGIITDSRSFYSSTGKSMKIYGAYDKEMMKYLMRLNWEFLFISSDHAGFEITKSRLDHLSKNNENISFMEYQSKNRADLIIDYKNKGYKVAFIGDSISDIGALSLSDYAGTTNNAPSIVKEYCDMISEKSGSFGGFAELIYHINDSLLRNAD